ncbi:MAG: putative fluoride ion transporter CrcB [Candidatus Hydrogenedentota bacterium]
MHNVLLVGLGGFIGSAGRYLVSGWVQQMVDKPLLPFGTLAVNVIGCLLIGLLGGLAEAREIMHSNARMFVMVGMLGGFTTFSTFGYETFALGRDGESLLALANIAAQVVMGFFAVWAGFTLAKAV